MSEKRKLITATVAAITFLGTGAPAFAAIEHPLLNPMFEKCAGVINKGMNDCASLDGKHSCAGESTVSDSPVEWAFMPVGTCAKITGGIVVGKEKARNLKLLCSKQKKNSRR